MSENHVKGDFWLDRRLLRTAFESAARGYDAAAVLQHEVGERLLERLDLTTLQPARILDLGCGTGRALGALRKHYPEAGVVGADIAFGMLAVARHAQSRFRRTPLVCADAMHLPFTAMSFDLIYCNLMLQWCNDLERIFAELRRLLRPHALLLFTTFGPDTLRELRAAWREVDSFKHVNRFIDMHDIGDALMRAGFVEPVMDMEHLTLTYTDVQTLMHDLKNIGAHNVTAGRAHGLTGRGRLLRMQSAYEKQRRDGRLPASYEVIYGTAWTPAYIPAAMLTPGEARAAIRKRRGDGDRN